MNRESEAATPPEDHTTATRCLYCGKPLSVEAKYYPECGKNVKRLVAGSGKRCSYCSTEVPEDAVFCPSCGAQFEDTDALCEKSKSGGSADTVSFPRWVIVLIGVGLLIWALSSILPTGEKTYRIEGTIETEVEVRPLPP